VSEKKEFLKDLSLVVPNIQDYVMIDWMILALWAGAVLLPSKNRSRTIVLVSIVELCWGMYDLSIGEFAQSIPFFVYFLSGSIQTLRLPLEETQ
jgi:hypothetical protein